MATELLGSRLILVKTKRRYRRKRVYPSSVSLNNLERYVASKRLIDLRAESEPEPEPYAVIDSEEVSDSYENFSYNLPQLISKAVCVEAIAWSIWKTVEVFIL